MKNNDTLSRTVNFARANSKEITRFLKFCVVGTLGAVIDFGSLNLLILSFGFSKILANTCSFSVAVISNFIWNRLWTFPEARDRPIVPQLGQFFLVNIGLAHYKLAYNLSKAIATIIVLFWNFGANRLWTYRGI